jgi:ArpU family phage transcriptional regulator
MSALQLSLLPKIDREATRKRVEEHLETVRVYKQIGLVRKEIRNTPSYAPRYHGNTNAISKPAEDNAVWNADMERELEELSVRVERAVSRLSKRQQELIRSRYLVDDDVLDFNVCLDLHMSDRSYRRVKGTAIYKLAFMLRLEVYEGD